MRQSRWWAGKAEFGEKVIGSRLWSTPCGPEVVRAGQLLELHRRHKMAWTLSGRHCGVRRGSAF